jgi:hypothetical protein
MYIKNVASSAINQITSPTILQTSATLFKATNHHLKLKLLEVAEVILFYFNGFVMFFFYTI